MVSPFVKNPLGGNLGARTASFFRLDPLGNVPIEPLLDLVPAFTPNRITFDMIDQEDFDLSFLVTENALQDFSSAQSNIHHNLDRITVSGTVISSINLPLIGSVGTPGIPGFGGGLRLDLIKTENLRELALRREPIMYVSPRESLPKCFIARIGKSWNPATGDNSILVVDLVEARIVNPLLAKSAIPDVANSATGNNSMTEAGSQSPNPVQSQNVSQGSTVGISPSVIPR